MAVFHSCIYCRRPRGQRFYECAPTLNHEIDEFAPKTGNHRCFLDVSMKYGLFRWTYFPPQKKPTIPWAQELGCPEETWSLGGDHGGSQELEGFHHGFNHENPIEHGWELVVQSTMVDRSSCHFRTKYLSTWQLFGPEKPDMLMFKYS